MLSCLKVVTYMPPGLGFSNVVSVNTPAHVFHGPSTCGTWLLVVLPAWKLSVDSGRTLTSRFSCTCRGWRAGEAGWRVGRMWAGGWYTAA